MEAEILHVTLKLYQNPLQRQLSLRFLYNIIAHLSHVIILNEGLAKELLDFFESVLNILVHNGFSFIPPVIQIVVFLKCYVSHWPPIQESWEVPLSQNFCPC